MAVVVVVGDVDVFEFATTGFVLNRICRQVETFESDPPMTNLCPA